jgi:hypothetical protein
MFGKKHVIIEFTHPALGQEVQAVAGYYVPVEEHVLPYNEREVIYIRGHACIEASCCGVGRWDYIQVPGFLVKKHIRGGGSASPVSEIEIIQNPEDRNSVWHFLKEKYPGAHIEIW